MLTGFTIICDKPDIKLIKMKYYIGESAPTYRVSNTSSLDLDYDPIYEIDCGEDDSIEATASVTKAAQRSKLPGVPVGNIFLVVLSILVVFCVVSFPDTTHRVLSKAGKW